MTKAPHPNVRAIAALAERMDRDMPGNSTVQSLKGEMSRVSMAAEALDRVRANRSPLDTPAAHAMKVAAKARQFDKEVTAMLNRTSTLWANNRTAIEQRIVEKVNLKPNKFDMEIRTRFAALPNDQRLDHLKAMIEGNRGPELAAIVDAPAFLTGLSPEQCAAFKQSMIGTHAADEVAEIAGLDEVFNHITSATTTASKYVRELTDPNSIAQIEREAAAAEDASAGFSQSLA